MANDMDKDIVDNNVPMVDPKWEANRIQHEARMYRQMAVEFAIKTEQISTISAGDTSEAIRKRIVDNADEYVMYIMHGAAKD